MEQQTKPSVMSTALRYGVIVGLISIIYTMVLEFAGLGLNQWAGSVGYLFFIGGMVAAHNAYKKENEGYMAYSTGLGIGTLLSLFSGILSTSFSFVYMKFIDTTKITKIMEKSVADMEARGLSDDMIEQSMEMQASFMTPEMVNIMALVFFVFVGFILSLIVSLITKKNHPQAF
jgi:hypothetical protein